MISTAQMEVQGETLVITGEVVFDTVVVICQQGLALMKKNSIAQIDLKGLKNCDSSVLVLCTSWIRTMRQQKKQVQLLNPPSFMQDLLRVHGLEHILPWR